MTTIHLPTEIEEPLAEEARRRGTTPELLALETLRERFVVDPATEEPTAQETLYDTLAGLIGTIDGTGEPLSEQCGERFADLLADEAKSVSP